MAEASGINWTAIEVPYKAGILTIKQIAKAFGCSDAAIIKHAAKNRWQRDELGPQIRREARRKAKEDQEAANQGQTANLKTPASASASPESERVNSRTLEVSHAREQELIEAVARMQADVIGAHKTDVLKAMKVVNGLMADLDEYRDHIEEIVADIKTDCKGDRDYRNKARMLRAVDAPSRSTQARALASAMAELVKIERQAFAMDAEGGGAEKATPLEQRLETYAREAAKVAGLADGSIVELTG